MASKRVVAATFVLSAIGVAACPLGASALILTTPQTNITNLPVNITPITSASTPVSSATGTGNLQFKAFNSTNFPSLWSGLLPNQTLKLNSVTLALKGTPTGSFTVSNQSNVVAQTIPVQNNVFTYIVTANGTNSSTLSVSNQQSTDQGVGNVPRAIKTDQTANTNPPPTCTSPKLGPYEDVDFGLYYCLTPGTKNFNLNPSNTLSSAISWVMAPNSGQTNSVESSFWTTGGNITLPTTLTFTPDSSKYSYVNGATVNQGILTSANFSFGLSSNANDTYLVYDYDVITNSGVPAPLPILGACMAFSGSRRIRRRIKKVPSPTI